MDRRDQQGTRSRISVSTIIVVIGIMISTLGVSGLVYRQLDSDSGAEAVALATKTEFAMTPTPIVTATASKDQAPNATSTALMSPSPTARVSATSTPSPSPTPASTPTMQPSPTPAATHTPMPTVATGTDEEPAEPGDTPIPAPPVPAAPEPPADESPDGSTVTHVQVPAAGIDAPVVEIGYNLIDIGGQTVIEWNVAEWAAGHHSISANPGDGGNIVIAGHVAGAGEVFRTLEQAEIGDEVTLSTTEGEFRYVIEEVHLRLEAGAPLEERLAIGAFMNPMPEERLTLITCWPYGVYDHRLIVVAKPA